MGKEGFLNMGVFLCFLTQNMILVIKNRLLKNGVYKSIGLFLKILKPVKKIQTGGRHEIMFLWYVLDKVRWLLQKRTFWYIQPTQNHFLVLKPLEKVLRTSKHHFWKVEFWWPNPYFRWERRGFWTWVFWLDFGHQNSTFQTRCSEVHRTLV